MAALRASMRCHAFGATIAARHTIGSGIARHKGDGRIGCDRDDGPEVAMTGILAARPGRNHHTIACIDLCLRQFHTSNGEAGLRTMFAPLQPRCARCNPCGHRSGDLTCSQVNP